MTRAMGRANAATSITTPKKARSVPTATTWIRWESCVASIRKPSASVPMPARVMSTPMTARRRSGADPTRGSSLIAATGEVRAARTAGMSAEPTVTTTPTITAAMTVRVSSTGVASGAPSPRRSKPTARNKRLANPTPAARPSPAATTPTMAASSTTDPSTCVRLAPSARSKPRLRRREVERGDRHASEIGLALEAEQSHDRELLGRSLEEHADAIAHLESVCPGRAFVDEHLTFAARRPALAVVREGERACARLRPREPDRRRETVLDRVAPVADELRVAERRPGGGRDAIDGAHPRHGRIRDARPL